MSAAASIEELEPPVEQEGEQVAEAQKPAEVAVGEPNGNNEPPNEEPIAEAHQLEPPLPVKLTEQDKKIKKAFDAFDQTGNGTVDFREVGTILRSIGICPTQEKLQEWVSCMEEDEPTGYVTWEKFHMVTTKLISKKFPTRDDEETLFRAFKALDEEEKGYLEPEVLKKYMTTVGEIFSKEEIDEMLAACTDPTENKIFYEDYITILAKQTPAAP